MKKIIYLLLVASNCFCINIAFAQKWYSYNPTAAFDINAVDILAPGYIVTGGGQESGDSVQTMFTSPDYGVTWNENPHDGLMSWNKSVAFSGLLNGFGVGYQGRVIKTTDGGQTWGNPVFPINRNFNKIVHASPLIYYAVGGRQSNDSLQTIIKTSDGGSTWNVIYDTAGSWLKSVYFITPLKGFAVGDSGVILATTNGGNSWSIVPAPIQRDFNAITFINADTGFIAGGSKAGSNRRTILRTQNGGLNWSVVSDMTGGILNDISFADFAVGYVVGDSAAVLKTSDGGQTWTPQVISNSLTGSNEFRAVKFYDRNFGIAAGKAGILYVYIGGSVDVFTLGAEVKDSTSADIFASANTHGISGVLTFTYSTDSTFATSFSTPMQSVASDTFFPAYASLTGLIPNTWYYYFAGSGGRSGDTLRFYTGVQATPVFKTLTGSVIDSATLLLRGQIYGIASVTNLVFEYGTSPNLGHVIAATPGSVSNTADHRDSAVLGSVQPYTIYYYRLRGVAGVDTLYGDIYFTGNPFRVIETLPATSITDSSATINGIEQGNTGPVNISFEYGPDMGTAFETPATYYSLSGSIRSVSFNLGGLLSNQQYYYRLKVQSGTGVFYGQVLSIYNSGSNILVQTFTAQNVNANSAVLEGMVNHLRAPAILSFEYSTDNSFANNIPAVPATVNDSLLHRVSAWLTGAQTNTTYYYRLKAVTNIGEVLYGNVQMVYIGDNEIPNWDFQLWNQNTYAVPYGWNIDSKNFSRVAGHSGNYALNMTGCNIAVLGFPSDDKQNGQGLKFLGGVPFTGRPDSISFYIKGSLVQGDSAAVIVYLHQGSTVIAKDISLIAVNTGGTFQRVSLPVHYRSGLSPDSLVLGITTVNPNRESYGNEVNNITIDDFAFIPATSPVYNGNFETWFNYTIELPESWFAPVFLGLDSINTTFTPMVSKTYFAPPADYAGTISNINRGNLGLLGGSLGFKSNAFYSDAREEFAVNSKHQTLTGFYESYPDNSDTLTIKVYMYNLGRQIGYGEFIITDTVTHFSPFVINILYFDSAFAITADSADIEMFPHGFTPDRARGLSRLIVDKLRFDGFAVDSDIISHIVPLAFDENGIKVYPNPSNDFMVLEISKAPANESVVQIFNLNGQKQKELVIAAGEEKTSFNVADMQAGFYLLRWISGDKVVSKKIIVFK